MIAGEPLGEIAERRPARLWLVPVLSTLAGSALSVSPFVVTVPLMPPLGLVMLIAWRLLRPEMWGAWVALPLGLADDLITGAPLGSGMAIWTIILLGLDLADNRLLWRDYWADWGLAMVAFAVATLAAWGIALFTGGASAPWTAAVQTLFATLLFPTAARLCRTLDRWRLGDRARIR